MEKPDYWRLCDEFTVVQAALLHIGIENPAVWENVLNMAEQDKPKGFSAAFTAFSHAIIGERLKATI